MDGVKAPGVSPSLFPAGSCAISSDFLVGADNVYGCEIAWEELVAAAAGWSLIPVTGFYGALEQNLFPRLQSAP